MLKLVYRRKEEVGDALTLAERSIELSIDNEGFDGVL